MPEQNLTATLSDTQLQDIKAALQTIQQHLPFCITRILDVNIRLLHLY